MFEYIPAIDPRAQRRKRLLIVGSIFAVICAAYLYYEFKNYPEERQLRRFFEALQQQDYQRAYQIWQPSDSYTFKNFLEDWGPDGYQGSVQEFQIADSQAEGSGVNITAIINGKQQAVLWVEKRDKSLSFSPIEPPVSVLSRFFPSLANLWKNRNRRRTVVSLTLTLLLAGYLFYEFRRSAGES